MILLKTSFWKNPLFIALTLGLSLSFGLVSCDDDNDNNSDDDATPEQQIIGTWMGVFDTPFEGPNDELCNAIFFDIESNGNIKILSFLDGEQAAGNRGTYTFENGDLTLNIKDDWAEEQGGEPFLNWIPAPFDITIYSNLSSDGTMLTAGPSETEAWETNKIDLTEPNPAFEGTWLGPNMDTLDIAEGGMYEYREAGYTESGSLQEVIYTDGNTYLFLNTTLTDDVSSGGVDSYGIIRADINAAGDEVTLLIGGNTLVLTKM